MSRKEKYVISSAKDYVKESLIEYIVTFSLFKV